MSPKRILILRLGAIGDCLRVLPALAAIRQKYPEAHIGWAVEHWVKPILEPHPSIDQLHILNRKALRAGKRSAWQEFQRCAQEIRQQKYDCVLDFHGRLKSGFLAWRSKIPQRIGFAKGQSTEQNHWFMNQLVTLDDPLENRVQRFLHLADAIGANPNFDPKLSGIYLTEEEKSFAQKWHQESGCPKVVAYPGCSQHQAAYHRWPAQKWVKLLTQCKDKGIEPVLFWGPDEKEFVEDIIAQADFGVMAPPTTLREMMAMLGQFQVYIGTNSAALHMSWLQGVSCAFFSGPAQPKTDGPLEPVPGIALRAGEFYVPGLSKRKQPKVTSEVPVDEAWSALNQLLEMRSSC